MNLLDTLFICLYSQEQKNKNKKTTDAKGYFANIFN